MAIETAILESPIAGKGGEPTAAAPSAASARPNVVNLTPDGMARLLASDFAAPETPAVPGQEVQPAPVGDDIPTVEAPEVPAEVVPEVPEVPEEKMVPVRLRSPET